MKNSHANEVLAELPVQPDQFVVETVTGVDMQSDVLDRVIDAHAHRWDVERLASVDRNILRTATWELLHRRELSIAIIISEALELAKKYSTDDSGRFVNGILSAIAEEVRHS